MTCVTHEELTKERNIFLFFFILLATFSALFMGLKMGGIIEITEDVQGFAVIMTLLSKGVFIYLVYRFSRFLKLSIGLTILYCLLAPFSVLYLIPFIGLLLKVKSVRKNISVLSESVKPTSGNSG
jgi:hypothetical protein